MTKITPLFQYLVSFFSLTLLLVLSTFSAPTLSSNTPFDDYFTTVTKNWKFASQSKWYKFESNLYRKVLAKTKAKVMVVPVQVQQFAIDAAGRDLMTYSLVDYIEQTSDDLVVNPTYVEKALGENQRTYNRRAIFKLANDLGVNKIIWVFAGHAQKMKLNLTLIEQKPDAQTGFSFSSPMNKKDWFDLPFTDIYTPYEVFNNLLPEINAYFKFGDRQYPKARTIEKHKNELRMDSPGQLSNHKYNNLIETALTYQMLGSLTPSYNTRKKERFFAKSLIILNRVSSDSPDYALLKARAYYYLNRRPASLVSLSNVKTAEEKSFYELLMGNYPDLKLHLKEIDSSFYRLMSTIEYADLHAKYEKPTFSKEEIKQQANITGLGEWKSFFVSRLKDKISWNRESNKGLKKQLDIFFPLSESGKNSSFEKFSSTLGSDEVKEETASYHHIKNYIHNNSSTICCSNNFFKPNKLDFLELLSAINDRNVFKLINFLLVIQGSPVKADALVKIFSPIYSGHPQFLIQQAMIDAALSLKTSGSVKQQFSQSAISKANNAYFWAQGQGKVSMKAANFLLKRTQVLPFFHGDFPRRSYWFNEPSMIDREFSQNNNDAFLENADVGLSYISSNFEYLEYYFETVNRYSDPKIDRNTLVEKFENRFLGHPRRARYFASIKVNLGLFNEAKSIFKREIELSPLSWEGYKGLGDLHIKQGNITKAVEAYNMYPLLKSPGEIGKVHLANNISHAGIMLYTRGHYNEAIPFLSQAKEMNTGSSLNLTSEYLLALENQNYVDSLKIVLRQSNRYGDNLSNSTYMSLLHLFGHHKMSNAIFTKRLNKGKFKINWAPMAMNYKMRDFSNSAVIEELDINFGQQYHSRLKAGLVYEMFMVDRIPPDNIQSLIQLYEGPEKRFVHTDGKVYVQLVGEKLNIKAGPDSYDNFDKIILEKNTTIPSELSLFAKAYQHLLNEDYAASHKVLIERAKFYSNDTSLYNYALPYFVWTHAKTGNLEKIKQYLHDYSNKNLDSFHLSMAIVYAFEKNNKKAIASMSMYANNHGMHSLSPHDSWYTLIEIAEWLYEETQNDVYAKSALRWAKHVQKITPYYSWPFAVEAKYGDDAKEKLFALGMAIYLDPQSRRVSQFSEKSRRYAKKYAEKLNPFIQSSLEIEKVVRTPH